MTSPSAVTIDNVSKQFNGVLALDEVSLVVRQGAFFGLLGPNGAGKTTLIGIIGGLVRLSGGSVSVLGNDITKAPLKVREVVGIVPQELTYDAFFTVREALTFQSKYYGLGANQNWVDELLEKLHLSDKADVNTRQLSGGMKRRLMIAQALVHKPPVIILDEPTAGVDINLRLSLWRFIRSLNADGHTIILTTHYLEEAEALCDEIVLMNHGKIITCGQPHELLATVKKSIELRILPTVAELPPGVPQVKQDGNQWVFHLTNYAEIEGILAAFRRADIGVEEMTVSSPKLEDVFIQMIGE